MDNNIHMDINEIKSNIIDHFDKSICEMSYEEIHSWHNIANYIMLKVMQKYNPNKIVGMKKKGSKKTRMMNYKINEGVRVKAYSINHKDECHNYKGFWCYHSDSSRFYTSINNIAIEGYLTNIIPDNETPHKVTEYIPNKYNKKNDNFYMPPELYGGNDIRNITERAKYVPHNKLKREDRYAYTIGDKKNITYDLYNSSDANIRYSANIGSHWTMVSFLCHREKEQRNRRNSHI